MGSLLEQLFSLIFSALKAIIVGFFSVLRWLFFPNQNKLYNNELMSKKDRKKLISPAKKGICVNGIDKLSLENSHKGTAVLAGTGAGKSTVVAICTVLQTDTTIYVLDPSLEIFEKTSGYKKSQGFETRILNFSQPKQSLAYNPLINADTDLKLREVASVLIKNVFPSKGNDQNFWNIASEDLLVVIFKVLRTQEPKYQNLPNALHLIQSFGQNRENVDRFVARVADEQLFLEYSSSVNAPPKMLMSVVQTCRVALQTLVSDPEVANLLSENTIGFQEGKSKKIIYYISAKESQLHGVFSGIVSVFFNQLFDYLQNCSTESPPVTLLLDELPTLTLPNLPQFATICRKYKVSLVLFCQDKSQLEYKLGKEQTQTLLQGGCNTTIYLGGQSLATSKELEQMIGKENVVIRDHKNQQREYIRPLLETSQIRKLPRNKAIIIHSNLSILITNTTPYYKQPMLLKRSKIAVAPSPNVTDRKVEYLVLRSST